MTANSICLNLGERFRKPRLKPYFLIPCPAVAEARSSDRYRINYFYISYFCCVPVSSFGKVEYDFTFFFGPCVALYSAMFSCRKFYINVIVG